MTMSKNELFDKVLVYVRNCYYDYHCKDKEDVNRIILEVINENPEEYDFIKLGVMVKRRCQGEL